MHKCIRTHYNEHECWQSEPDFSRIRDKSSRFLHDNDCGLHLHRMVRPWEPKRTSRGENRDKNTCRPSFFYVFASALSRARMREPDGGLPTQFLYKALSHGPPADQATACELIMGKFRTITI